MGFGVTIFVTPFTSSALPPIGPDSVAAEYDDPLEAVYLVKEISMELLHTLQRSSDGVSHSVLVGLRHWPEFGNSVQSFSNEERNAHPEEGG